MDLGPAFGCGLPECKPGCECDRYQEFWNLVFPQFHQDEEGTLHLLPRPGIDTGMGLERLAQLVQGKGSVFQTDEFLPLRDAALDLAPRGDEDNPEHRVSLNIISEHARAVNAFAEDYPSMIRGYVARGSSVAPPPREDAGADEPSSVA
jgi:alanyl-tRNA synthetase